jgi:hypothetical protein
MLDSAIGAAGRYEARLEASGGLAEADEHRGGTLSPLAAFSEKLCHYKGAWGREKRPLAERQGSPAATRRLGVFQIAPPTDGTADPALAGL